MRIPFLLRSTAILGSIWLTPLLAQQTPPPPPTAPSAPERPAPPRAPQGPQVTSPEVSADRRITLRILAPKADAVAVRATDIPQLAQPNSSLAFTKNNDGVWEATTDPVPAGAYRYTFLIDGVPVVDPRNPHVSESNTTAWSLVLVPGSDLFDLKQLPHGAVESVNYYSTSLGCFRRMHVYTPPGYENNQQKYPIFYLLHGAGDSDDSWTSVGRANVIIDNLIATGKVKPMVIVMPAGHTRATFNMRPPGPADAPAPRDEFYDDFVNDIMPYAEKQYRVLADRDHRAIAGLSMGGGQTLNIAFSHLNEFAYIGVFSSGIFGAGGPSKWETDHSADLDNTPLKKGVKLIWFSTGANDRLITNSKSTVDLLKKHGFEVAFQESQGAHTWLNWRDYLSEFAPQLFQ